MGGWVGGWVGGGTDLPEWVFVFLCPVLEVEGFSSSYLSEKELEAALVDLLVDLLGGWVGGLNELL